MKESTYSKASGQSYNFQIWFVLSAKTHFWESSYILMCLATHWPVELVEQLNCQLACLGSHLPYLACGQKVCPRGVLNPFLHIVKIRSSISTYQGGSATCLVDNFC